MCLLQPHGNTRGSLSLTTNRLLWLLSELLTAASRSECDAVAGHAGLVLSEAVNHQVVGGPGLQVVQSRTLLPGRHQEVTVIVIIFTLPTSLVGHVLTRSKAHVTNFHCRDLQ